MIEVLDLFSAAAGGWSLGMHRAGFTTMAACEVEAWRRALYSENNPNVKVYDDVRTLTADRLLRDLGRLPSVVVGSPPCQDISSANTKGRGVEGERSGLYFEAVRIIGECRPRWFALENSANLRTRGADAVCAALEAIGYTCWPFVVRAGDIDANHERPRAWLIGCDLAQVAAIDASGLGYEGWRPWGHRPDGLGEAPVAGSYVGDAKEDGCRSGVQGRHPEPAEWIRIEACGDAPYADGDGEHASSIHGQVAELRWMGGDREPSHAADTASVRRFARAGDDEGPGRETHRNEPADGAASGRDSDHGSIGPGHVCKHGVRWSHACEPCDDAAWASRDAPDADQAGQADGCLEPGVRQAKIADDGCGAGRCDDGSIAGQMGICAANRGDAVIGRADWSLAHLADHLRLDDGLSARLAGRRVDIGDGKGQSAASLIVEAFGDAVIPQIPEAIGRAILRTERALGEIYGRVAA